MLDESVEELRAVRVAPQQCVEQIAADLSDPNELRVAFDATVRALGAVDVLVNNAGMLGPIGRLEDTDPKEWALTIQVNLLAPVCLMRLALPGMRSRGRGKIINLSGGGATGPRPHFSAYAAAKAALVRTTETVADEVKTSGIDVNAVAPGAMNSRLLEQVLAAGPERVGHNEYNRALEQREHGGAQPARAADLIAWLASSASDGITGRLLSAVWDPWEHLSEHRDDLAKSDVYTLRRIVPEDRGKQWAPNQR
jgi:3-oxoacyl-[acyl-carrier protein] reductase